MLVYLISRETIRKEEVKISITADLLRGHTETIILTQLLSHDSYGYEINKSIQEATDNEYELKEATLYTAFRRLEMAGYITSYWGDQNSGARRRYYKITQLGREAHSRHLTEWDSAKKLIDKLLGKGENNNA